MNMMKLMKQAQAMQSKMQQMQQELGKKHYEASAGGNAIKAVTSGDGNLISLKIDPEFLKQADAEMLEDLLLTAIRESLEKGRTEMQGEMGKMTAGLGLPPGLM